MSDLDRKFEELKTYSKQKELERLNKRIYDLKLSDEYLSNLSNDLLAYIHIKLHNAMSYKKPFASFDRIKVVHDKIAILLTHHHKFDRLDSSEK